MNTRSGLHMVRNPLLALDEVRKLRELLNKNPEVRAAFLALLMAISRMCATSAEKSWRKSKAPMAVYWKATGIYAKHLSRALRHA